MPGTSVRQRPGEWAEEELLAPRMQQAERGAVRSGDGVYTLAWEPSNRWALLRTGALCGGDLE
ncbi:hypothetical protein [Streptomyces sp. NPDC056105]|uniref:hypothetical protein n=1 Tax=Streptomyces sp. NPDC056105 TaxID=3345714 RepID=UPI0035DA9589